MKKAKKKQELPFDPEKDIFNSDWQRMKKELEEFRQNKEWWDFSWQAMKMKSLLPKK